MNEYELLYVITPRLAAEEVDGAVAAVQGLIESAGGEVMMTDNWGRRRLAYPIKHHFEGTYVLLHLRMPPDRTAGFERALHINEQILRHLLTRGIIPDYQGPPEQEVMEARRPPPPRREEPRASEPSGDADAGSAEEQPAEEQPAEEQPAEEGAADAPATEEERPAEAPATAAAE